MRQDRSGAAGAGRPLQERSACSRSACCVSTRIHSTLDLRASLDEQASSARYSVPGDVPAVQVSAVPLQARIPDKLRSGDLEEAGLEIEVLFDNECGTARARLAVHVADSADGVYESEPLLSLDIDLVPGLQRTISRAVSTSPRLLDLLRQDRLYLGIQSRWDTPLSGKLEGTYRILALRLRVTSRIGGITASNEMQPPPQFPR